MHSLAGFACFGQLAVGQIDRSSINLPLNGASTPVPLSNFGDPAIIGTEISANSYAARLCSRMQINPLWWCTNDVTEQLQAMLTLKWAPMPNMRPLEANDFLELLLRTVQGAMHPGAYKAYLHQLLGTAQNPLGLTLQSADNLKTLRQLIGYVHEHNLPGDVMECGVWRGGAMMFAKGVLKSLRSSRSVWLADSFEGLPPATLPAGAGSLSLELEDHWSLIKDLGVSLAHVRESFQRLDLLDDNVHFVQGFFNDSLPQLISRLPQLTIAILRVDADMWEGYMDVLFNLYDRVPAGGFIIADDFGIPVAQRAVLDFRRWHNITSPMWQVDEYTVYWQKERVEPVQWQMYDYLKSHRSLDAAKRRQVQLDPLIMWNGLP